MRYILPLCSLGTIAKLAAPEPVLFHVGGNNFSGCSDVVKLADQVLFNSMLSCIWLSWSS